MAIPEARARVLIVRIKRGKIALDFAARLERSRIAGNVGDAAIGLISPPVARAAVMEVVRHCGRDIGRHAPGVVPGHLGAIGSGLELAESVSWEDSANVNLA